MFCNQTELMGVMRDGELAVAWWSAVRIAAALPWLTPCRKNTQLSAWFCRSGTLHFFLFSYVWRVFQGRIT